MGSKRVGLARTEALIENLKRELSLGGSTLVGVAQSKLTVKNTAKGTDIANDTATVNLTTADHGKIFGSILASVAKTINLPANMGVADIGTTFTILQAANLVADGVLTINTGTGNTWCPNGYVLEYDSSTYAMERPSDANTRVVFTGADTNSSFGKGSMVTITCVAAGEWLIESKHEPLGTGNSATAFSTP
jgi:hypothetical protein